MIVSGPDRIAAESSAAIEAIYRDAGFPEGAYVNLYVTNDQAATIIADPLFDPTGARMRM